MAIGDYDAIDRAARRLRGVPEPGWQTIEQNVIAAVRATPRAGWPIDVDDPGPDVPGRLRVGDLVVSSLLSRALFGDPDFVVTDIDITSEDAVLQKVLITLSGRYGADLSTAATRARAIAAAVVDDVVGRRPDAEITVTVQDVHS